MLKDSLIIFGVLDLVALIFGLFSGELAPFLGSLIASVLFCGIIALTTMYERK